MNTSAGREIRAWNKYKLTVVAAEKKLRQKQDRAAKAYSKAIDDAWEKYKLSIANLNKEGE